MDIDNGIASVTSGAARMKTVQRRMDLPHAVVVRRSAEWEKFAETDAFGYIMTDLAGGEPQVFWDSGRSTILKEVLPVITEFGVNRDTALEIGCGVGRLIFPLCEIFRNVIGADISAGMIGRARGFAEERSVANAHFIQVSQASDLLAAMADVTGRATFVYSLLVFQHIEDFQTIDSYLAAIGQVLSRDGVAYLQFDTRRRTPAYGMKTALPDFALPKFWRRGVRRIRQSPDDIRRSLGKNHLRILAEKSPQSAYHRYVVGLA